MAGEIDMKVSGLDAALRAMEKLPDKAQRRVLRGAERRGVSVIRKHVKAATPVRTGRLRSQLKTQVRFDRRKTTIRGKVGFGSSFASMLESGTVERKRKRIGGKFAAPFGGLGDRRNKGTGRVKATHFMTRALSKARNQAIAAFSGRFRALLDKEVAKK